MIKRDESRMWAVFTRMAREDLSEKVTFELRPKKNESNVGEVNFRQSI